MRQIICWKISENLGRTYIAFKLVWSVSILTCTISAELDNFAKIKIVREWKYTATRNCHLI